MNSDAREDFKIPSLYQVPLEALGIIDAARLLFNRAKLVKAPLKCPIDAIYSKRDNIVSWQACIDHWSPRVTHHEIGQASLSTEN